MKAHTITSALLIALFLASIGGRAWGATHYVDLNSPSPTPPYTNWSTAATSIQPAVDAALVGSTVLVSNGVYVLTDEVVADIPITIMSLNGPGVTIVDGAGSNRCFNLGYANPVLSGLTITNGYTSGSGGGIYCAGSALITNCVITGNSAIGTVTSGGGVRNGMIKNSKIVGNISNHGGGVANGVLINCVVADNTARYFGGGVRFGSAYNCTISGNTASSGGGTIGATLYNCVVWDNVASIAYPNIEGGNPEFTCSPDVVDGLYGNITNAPLLVSASHLATNSPCRGAGFFPYTSGTDIDGQLWSDPPSMGADEYNGSVTGPLHCAIESNSKVVAGHPLQIRGFIGGAPTMHVWDYGDGAVATNDISLEYVWSSPGAYPLVLTAYNDTYPAGVSATQSVYVASVADTTIHVSLDGNDLNNGDTWVAAKASVQAGVDAQDYSGGLVLVSNGTYLVNSEIKVTTDIAIQGVAGPENTVVDGQGSVRCFNLGAAACMLSGLTITNGYAVGSSSGGGGVNCIGARPFITNCVVVGNTAGAEGGGLHSGTVYNSRILNNVALTPSYGGGGMVWGIVHNCEISGNTANQGGGVRYSLMDNCIISSNTADYGGGTYGGTANNSTYIGNVAVSDGGGIEDGIAYNCTFIGNKAGGFGGGADKTDAFNCTFTSNLAFVGGGMFDEDAYNCTFTGNTADYGGGMASGFAFNCIFKDNYATDSGNDINGLYSITHSCSVDLTPGVEGNITNAPLFIGTGYYRLAPNSPCINAGSNAYVSVSTDLGGHPRIIDGTVDMGAYESFYVTDSHPTASGFALEWMTPATGWSSVVKYSTNLVEMSFTDLSGSMAYPVNSFTDTVHAADSECFYQVEMVP